VPLNLEDKKALVKEVAEIAAVAQSVVAAEYRGITVTQMTELRAKARAQGVYMRVVKNTLARKAMVGTSFEAVGAQLKGPLVLAFSKDDPGGQVLPGSDLEKVASLPTREQALSMLLGTLKAPIEKFVRTVVAPHTKLVRTVAAVRDAKQAASG
jgi:large subunit ribosomal protein L10